MTNGLVIGSDIKAAGVAELIEAVTLAGTDLGDPGASETIDLANGQVQYGELTAACAIALPAPGAAQQYLRLVLTQDDTGGFLPQFYAVDGTPIEWVGLGCQAPSLDTIPNAPFATAVFSFDIGESRIIGKLENPHLPNIITTPALITDPREVDSGLVMWLDAADRSTLIDGTGVYAWIDKSGNGHSPIQATPANQPAFGTLVSGTDGIQFSTGKTLGLADHSDFDSADITVFLVFKRITDTGASHQIVTKGSAGSSNLEWIISVSSSDTANFNVSINGTNTTGGRAWNDAANTANTPYIYEMVVDSLGADVIFSRVNGGTPASAAFTGTRFTGAGILNFLGNPDVVGEFIMYNSALSVTKRDKIVAYLSAKWGI